MTAKDIIELGTARNKTLDPKDCVFDLGDGPSLEKWAKDNGVLWNSSDAVTASSLDDMLDSHSFLLALEYQGSGKYGLVIVGQDDDKDALLEQAARSRTGKMSFILLGRRDLRQPNKLPSMEF